MGAQAKARQARQAERQERDQGERNRLPPWTPFEQVTPQLAPEKREAMIRDVLRLAESQGQEPGRERVEAMINDHLNEEMWQNSRYTVIVIRDEEQAPDTPKMIHLSIRRNDRQRPREERYRDFQRIKSELVGPENEGVELYPAESRVADCADQYHVYVLEDPELGFGFGYKTGMRMGPTPGSPATQTPFEE
jgi:hypothetical protein